MTEYDNTNSGALFKADEQKSDKHPSHTGSINVAGVEYWLSAWVNVSKKGQKYFSLKVKPKDESAGATQRPAQETDDLDDEIPF